MRESRVLKVRANNAFRKSFQNSKCNAPDLHFCVKLGVVGTCEVKSSGVESLHGALIRRLRAEGAAGATALRGLWGYHGEHRPHGERFWSLRRHVPMLTGLLDTPANMRRWFEIVDEVTRETGLVTSEIVPALRAAGPTGEHGGLELAPRSTLERYPTRGALK